MEIKFEKLNGLYVAEFEATSDFNLHVERNQRGAFTIAQRGTKQGKYAYITDENYDDRVTIDVDVLGNIYPKYIKVTSVTEPTYAEVNMKSEGGGSGDGGGITYFDMSGDGTNSPLKNAFLYSTIVKVIVETGAPEMGINAGDILIFPTTMSFEFEAALSFTPIACGIALQERTIAMGQSYTIEDFIIDTIGEEVYNSLPRITKEEFYNTTA